MHAYKIIIYGSYIIWTLWTHIDMYNIYIYRIMDARKRSSHGCVLPPANGLFFLHQNQGDVVSRFRERMGNFAKMAGTSGICSFIWKYMV